MPHNIVFVVGPPRTGTSVLVKCLEKSGYNIGKQMLGHKYLSQNTVFRRANRKIKRLLYEQLVGSGHDPKKPVEIGEPIAEEIKKFWRYATLYKIEVLKDPLFYEIFGVYWMVNPLFREQKFIWTHRDPLEAAKSAVRLKYIKNVPEAEPLTSYTVKGRLKTFDTYENIHATYYNRTDGVNVHFEDLLNDTESVGKELSEFLERPFDTSMISTKETFKEKGEPQ